MRYGLPYLGSKNGIAEWVVYQLPQAEVFCDLFCGGGAITHCAMTKYKYKQFIMNDIDARMPKFFTECIEGKYSPDNHPEWISREEFNAKKDEDIFIALVWSFGNNGTAYIYGADIEDIKHAYHKAIYDNDLTDMLNYGYKIRLSNCSKVYGRYLDYQQQIKSQFASRNYIDLDNSSPELLDRLQTLERLQSLQSLQALQSLTSLTALNSMPAALSLKTYGGDYQDVPIPKGAVIYCDIPYISTDCGKYDGFDHPRFYEWAEKQDNIFISEYTMPDNFVLIAETDKRVLSSTDNSLKAVERLYTNQRTWDSFTDEQKARYKSNFSKKRTLFDL